MPSEFAFDPRHVPVSRVDAHLPHVEGRWLTSEGLRYCFRHMAKLQPECSSELPPGEQPLIHAAVLIPVVQRAELTVLFTQRASHLSSHAGQIAFPGGKVDIHDRDAVAAALRETSEEIAVTACDIEVIGQMPTYTTRSRFQMTPVVGLVSPEICPKPNENEVADIFEVPLAFLMRPENHRHHALEIDGVRNTWISMPYRDGDRERYIWGATAAVVRNMYIFLARI